MKLCRILIALTVTCALFSSISAQTQTRHTFANPLDILVGHERGYRGGEPVVLIFQDNYYLGETMTLSHGMDEMKVENLDVGDGTIRAAYCFTDIYGQRYWSEFLDY